MNGSIVGGRIFMMNRSVDGRCEESCSLCFELFHCVDNTRDGSDSRHVNFMGVGGVCMTWMQCDFVGDSQSWSGLLLKGVFS